MVASRIFHRGLRSLRQHLVVRDELPSIGKKKFDRHHFAKARKRMDTIAMRSHQGRRRRRAIRDRGQMFRKRSLMLVWRGESAGADVRFPSGVEHARLVQRQRLGEVLWEK